MVASTLSKILSLAPRSFSSPIDEDSLLHKLVPNPWDFLVQVLAFVVLLLVITLIAYKPVKKLIQKRKDYVEGNIQGSLDAKKKAEENLKQSEMAITESKEEARTIVESARLEAEKTAEGIVQKAESDARDRLKRADAEIEEAKLKAREEVKSEIVDVALAASSKIIGREVNEEDNQRLVSEFVEELDNGGHR